MTDLDNDLIIDFTFVEPTARSHGAYNKAGQAALKGKEKKLKSEYKHWNVLGDTVTNKFYIVAVETFGIILKDDIFLYQSERKLISSSSSRNSTAISRSTYYTSHPI